MIFGKAKKTENAEVPSSIYIRNEARNLVNKLVFTPSEVYNPPVRYNTPTIRLPGSKTRNDVKEFDSIEYIKDSSKMTIPIHICGRKLAKHRIYNEDPELNLVPTDLREEGLDKFFDRVLDTIIHYRMKGYNIKIVNGINESAYEPIESKEFNELKNYMGFGLEEKVK